MSRLLLGTLSLAVVLGVSLAAPVPKTAPPTVGEKNENKLITAHRDKLVLAASSQWDNWPVGHAFDGNAETSWYSNNGDAPQNGKTPTITVTFPEDVRVKRVTILGNRDPQYPDGYFATEGKFELLDKDDKVLETREMKSAGEKRDFDWVLKKVTGVRSIRFTMTMDEGKTGCVGVGEFQVE